MQCLDMYCSVLSAFLIPLLSSVIVSSFLWYLYINYASLTPACGRISDTFCPNTAFGIFFLFCSAFSFPPFRMLLVCSVWASLLYFILGCFFFSSPCTVQDSAFWPAVSLLLSILRLIWGPGSRSFKLLMFLFMILQVEYLVNGHILCVITYWMHFFTKAVPLSNSYIITKCLCLYITSRLPYLQFFTNGGGFLHRLCWCAYITSRQTFKPQLLLLLLLPSLTDMQEPECFGKETSHNESQFTKSSSKTLRMRKQTDQNRRGAGLNMNLWPPHRSLAGCMNNR